jgi:hypothetical protein
VRKEKSRPYPKNKNKQTKTTGLETKKTSGKGLVGKAGEAS